MKSYRRSTAGRSGRIPLVVRKIAIWSRPYALMNACGPLANLGHPRESRMRSAAGLACATLFFHPPAGMRINAREDFGNGIDQHSID